MMAIVLRPGKSSTETEPAPTFDVYPRLPSREITSMCDSFCPVGTVPTTLSVLGSTMLTVWSSSVVT